MGFFNTVCTAILFFHVLESGGEILVEEQQETVVNSFMQYAAGQSCSSNVI
jgi:hypothetical protein